MKNINCLTWKHLIYLFSKNAEECLAKSEFGRYGEFRNMEANALWEYLKIKPME